MTRINQDNEAKMKKLLFELEEEKQKKKRLADDAQRRTKDL